MFQNLVSTNVSDMTQLYKIFKVDSIKSAEEKRFLFSFRSHFIPERVFKHFFYFNVHFYYVVLALSLTYSKHYQELIYISFT